MTTHARPLHCASFPTRCLGQRRWGRHEEALEIWQQISQGAARQTPRAHAPQRFEGGAPSAFDRYRAGCQGDAPSPRALMRRLSSRLPRQKSSRLLAALPAIFSRCLQPSWKKPFAYVAPPSETSIAGRTKPCTWWRRTIRRLPSLKFAGVLRFVLIRNRLLPAWWQRKRRSTFPIWPPNRSILSAIRRR